MGDLNLEVSENCLNSFSNVNRLKTLNRGPTCFKNPNNPSCIDLLFTNRQQCFQQICVIETGISDFHKILVTVMKTHYERQKAKTIQYRNYKHFHEQSFNFELNNELLKIDTNNTELKEVNEIFLKVLDKHAPRKQKYIRANNSNYNLFFYKNQKILFEAGCSFFFFFLFETEMFLICSYFPN